MPKKKTLKQRILAVRCPRCGSANGRKCRGMQGTCHSERLHAWQESADGKAHAASRGINLAKSHHEGNTIYLGNDRPKTTEQPE